MATPYVPDMINIENGAKRIEPDLAIKINFRPKRGGLDQVPSRYMAFGFDDQVTGEQERAKEWDT